MDTINMRFKDTTYNISGNMVRLKPVANPSDTHHPWLLRIEGLANDTVVFGYTNKDNLLQDVGAFKDLLYKLSIIGMGTWGNSKGVMSRGEIQLMRLAILCGGISVLACLVYLLVILFK